MYKSSYRNNPILQIILPLYYHSYDPWYLFEIFRYHFDSSLDPSNLQSLHLRGKDPPHPSSVFQSSRPFPQRLSYGHVIVAARSMAAWFLNAPRAPLAPRLSSWADPSGPVDGSEIPNNHLTGMKPWKNKGYCMILYYYISTGAGFLPSTVCLKKLK